MAASGRKLRLERIMTREAILNESPFLAADVTGLRAKLGIRQKSIHAGGAR